MSEIDNINLLIEAVSTADGRLDDVILGKVICALKDTPWDNWAEHDGYIAFYGKAGVVWQSPREAAPDVSIDAAIGLLEDTFPGWLWTMGSCWVSDDARIFPDFNFPIHGPALHAHFGEYKKGSPLDEGFDVARTPPLGKPCLAMLEAMLMAKAFVLEFGAARVGKVGAA